MTYHKTALQLRLSCRCFMGTHQQPL